MSKVYKDRASQLADALESNPAIRKIDLDYDNDYYVIMEALLFYANHYCSLPAGMQEALNSGDGVYRP